MKKVVLSAALLAIFTGGMTAAVNVVAPETAVACAAESDTSTALAASLPQVNHGDRGRHVLALQLALRFEGYTYLQGTGTYASQTLKAVQDFQRKNGIKASGVVGAKTWQALVGKKSKNVTGGRLGFVTPFSLRPGERNQAKVDLLYNMLGRIHPYRDEPAPVDTLSDSYGPKMQRMVRDFQKRAGFKASGIVGPKTVAALEEVISVSGQWGC
jgi:peptidoglycan hydrolase-like protein with peptidoglycan-binding domain